MGCHQHLHACPKPLCVSKTRLKIACTAFGTTHLLCKRNGAQWGRNWGAMGAQWAEWAGWAGNARCGPAMAQCARNSCNATEPGTVPTMGAILLKSVKWPAISANRVQTSPKFRWMHGQF